jgi:O-antigen/teichoic acid export membrane protein
MDSPDSQSEPENDNFNPMGVARKIITNVVSLSGSNFIARFLSFFSVLLIVRGLSLYEYGILTLAMAVTGPVAALAGFGLDSVFTSDAARYIGEKNYARARKLISEFVKNKIVITLAVLICGWFFRGILEKQYGTIVSTYFIWLAIWVLVQTLRTIADLLAQIYERFVVLSVANVLETVVKLIVVLVFWKTIGLTVISVLWVYIISKFVSFLIVAAPIYISQRALAKIAPKPEKESVIWDIMKRHGKWEMVRNVLSSVTSSIKPWLIKILLNTESVAIYSFASTIFSVISQLLPMKNVIFPIIVKRINDKNFSSLLAQKVNKYSVLFYVVVIIAFFIAGDYAVALFFPKYISSVLLIKIMLFNLLITAIGASQNVILYGLRKQKILLFFNDFVIVISRLALLPLLILWFGLPGTAMEMIIAPLLIVIFFEYYLRSKMGITTWRWKDLFIFDRYDKWFFKKILVKAGFLKADINSSQE